MSLDLLQSNPMAKIKKVTHKPTTVEWTKAQVKTFIDECFSDFDYRSLGLLTLMAYEWAQRPVDITALTWSDLDLDEGVATITQSKRGATVYLPIEEPLLQLLKDQKEDFDFQDYVVPYLRGDNAWRPMDTSIYSRLKKEVLEKTELPLNLAIGSLRKTGIIEMFDEGVDLGTMMSVTGHKSLASLDAYQKNTLTASKKALQQRKGLN
jgi:integrase